MKIKQSIDETVIYQAKNGAITLKRDASSDMLWASQNLAFRQWTTKTLKEHIQMGYTINRHRIKSNYEDFLKAV